MSTSRFTIIIFLLIIPVILWSFQFSVCAGMGQPVNDSATRLPSQQKKVSIQRTQRAGLDRFTFAELHMGVRTRLTVYARDEAHARQACRLAFDRVSQLENSMSDYRLNSEINRLAQNAGAPLRISNDLFYVLAYAQQLARLTDGAFDITVSPLVRLWREARGDKKLPDKQKLEAARSLVGWKNLKLNRKNQTAQLLKKGMQLDLGAIAKGYAGDCALNVLKAQGINRALFEAGGDVVLSEAPPSAKGWKIEIENATSSGAPRIVQLKNAGLGASGDTNQFVVIGGKRYSHVVNAKTGLGLTNRVAVTVIAPRGILSDSLSTAWSLANKKQRQRLKRAFPQAQVFLRHLK